MIDTHIHLSHPQFREIFPYLAYEAGTYSIERGTLPEVIAALRAHGITACIEPAIEPPSNARLLALAKEYPEFLYPAVGVHPSRTYSCGVKGEGMQKLPLHGFPELRELAKDPLVAAIGETGLDYHNPKRSGQHRLRQKLWFVRQIRLADELRLPLILHIRDAYEDALRILRRHQGALHGGVCHCYDSDAETAAAYVALGLHIGIGGKLLGAPEQVTALEEAVRQTPLSHILLETDGPYVKPANTGLPEKPLQKSRNTSLILPAVASRIAELKGISAEEVVRAADDNAKKLFRLSEREVSQ